MNKGFGWIVFILIVFFILFSCFLSSEGKKKNTIEVLEGKYTILIKVKKYGDIKVELDADVAPITVTHFVDLVKSKFYDGLTFTRVKENFMIQGGDPTVKGRSTASTIKGEFAANDVTNNLSHVRGTISMARTSSDYDSASSQFFIVQKDSTYLDGSYAAFGTVISGMDVVDKIVKEVVPYNDNGNVELDDQPIIESIELVE